ncbi:hypothetical protein [Salinicoccus roseus]|uniref:hypothetical protein n=1 Tax=Salinicoccus roseus TaxID=45670 RepID=UPI0015CB2E4D|nr:hypothetical protein [Salinicoccus roseus]
MAGLFLYQPFFFISVTDIVIMQLPDKAHDAGSAIAPGRPRRQHPSSAFTLFR